MYITSFIIFSRHQYGRKRRHLTGLLSSDIASQKQSDRDMVKNVSERIAQASQRLRFHRQQTAVRFWH